MTPDDPRGRPPGRDASPVAGTGEPSRATDGRGDQGAQVLAGRYELGEVLGRGGMASVRVAHDRVLGRQVAIKLLRPDLAHDPEVLSRFRREARAVAALNHPSVVGVHDVGEDALGPHDPPVPFLVMELVRGATVRDLLAQHRPAHHERAEHEPAGDGRAEDGATQHRPAHDVPTVAADRAPAPDEGSRVAREADDATRALDPRDQPGVGVEMAVAITTGVLTALAYSHRAGIVHRDIKPANVMLTPDGQVKVMDFGIARALADVSATATHTSAVLGTAQYLSPEQARGRPVDARADLYSTGCLL